MGARWRLLALRLRSYSSVVQHRVTGAVGGVGGLVLISSLLLPWFELRLYTWQGGPGRDIDNPFILLAPWQSTWWPETAYRLPGPAVYVGIGLAAMLALIISVRAAIVPAETNRNAAMVGACGLVVLSLVAVAAVLAFDTDSPSSYHPDVVRVEMVPMWGIIPAVLAAVAMAATGWTARLVRALDSSGAAS